FWITETVTKPWGVKKQVNLFGWYLWFLRFRLRDAIMLFSIIGGAINVCQGVKSGVMERGQEPRPIVVWLEKTHHMPVDEIYTL
ncbi:phosphatidylglycerophosphatase B, partial [Salmonella enterica subsp. enterica serovar Kentucky]